ncbi:hypothetical protein Q9966_009857 [Columba livia]|nr:hypothetical protein Q9966_009857 [Columba livia]
MSREKNLRKRQNPESRATSQILIVFGRSLPDGGLLGRGLAQSTAEDPSPEMMVAVDDHYLTTFLIDTGDQILMVDIPKTGGENGAYLAISSQRYKVKLIKRETFFNFLEKVVGFFHL